MRRSCRSGKVRFRDHDEAVHALHKAAVARHWAESEGVETRRREARTYACTSCNGWHLTSRTVFPLSMPA
jgi:hypothetical protein